MSVFWDWAPGTYWCKLVPRFVEGAELCFEAAWWWVVFPRGSRGLLMATGLNSWEISAKTTCYLNSTWLLPHPLRPFISWSVLTSVAHPVCSYTQTVKTPREVNTHLSQRQTHPGETLHTYTVRAHKHVREHRNKHVQSKTERTSEKEAW